MEKEFIQSSNYFVADTLNGEPEVYIDNYIDEDLRSQYPERFSERAVALA